MTEPSSSSQNGSSDSHVTLAITKYAFNGKNNDELSFAKNDVIMLTQQIEGGWWEGTLNGTTGWFPANYVTILSEKEKLARSKSVPSNVDDEQKVIEHSEPSIQHRNMFRDKVLKDFLDNEQNYLVRLRKTVQEYLKPLKQAQIMSDEDYDTLCGNIEQILHFQTDVMHKINLTLEEDISKQRVGGVLINAAAALKDMLMIYCENHPKAVEVMNEKEEELKVFVDTICGDKRELVMGLSEPFCHLGRYAVSLQELARSMPDSHIDRGDVQRSCAVYKDMKYECDAVRRQKEMQLEFLAGYDVDEWALFSERGRIKYVTLADVQRPFSNDDEPKPRLAVLFANILLILHIEQKSYRLSEKMKTEGFRVKKVEGRNAVAFGPPENPTVLSVGTQVEADRLLAAFAQCHGVVVEDTSAVIAPAQKIHVENLTSISSPRQPDVSSSPAPNFARVAKKPSFGPSDLKFNHELEMVVPEGDDSLTRGRETTPSTLASTCLRPFPPVRGPNYAVNYNKKSVKMRTKENQQESSEDALLLKIVEGYWQSGKSVPQIYQQAPQLIVADDEKLLVEEMIDGQMVIQEKSLVDTVYALKDQVSSLQKKLELMCSTVEKEQRARRRLEDIYRRRSAEQTTAKSEVLPDALPSN